VAVQDLVIITGPIASGKSTVADLLAQRCASQGRSVAGADLDDVAFAQDGCPDLAEFWRRAGVAHAALVRGWLAAGTEVVIAHGPISEARSYDSLRAAADHGSRTHHVLLTVRLDIALQRVAADPSRPPTALSRDPDFVRATYDAFFALDLPSINETFDTSQTMAADIAEKLNRRLRLGS
jgi:shikimate kinase